MKHIYLILFFFTISFGYAQNSGTKGDIDGFKLYPNPVTNGKVFISTTENAKKKVLIFDVLGTQVFQTSIVGKELNISDLDAGVYVLRVYENRRVSTRKLIVK